MTEEPLLNINLFRSAQWGPFPDLQNCLPCREKFGCRLPPLRQPPPPRIDHQHVNIPPPPVALIPSEVWWRRETVLNSEAA